VTSVLNFLFFSTGVYRQKIFCLHGHSYDPFGSLEKQKTKTDNDKLHIGMEHDFETGLIYNWKRYRNPKTGRWLSRDSVAGKLIRPQLLNRYVYVNNNPLTVIDPTGNGGYAGPLMRFWIEWERKKKFEQDVKLYSEGKINKIKYNPLSGDDLLKLVTWIATEALALSPHCPAAGIDGETIRLELFPWVYTKGYLLYDDTLEKIKVKEAYLFKIEYFAIKKEFEEKGKFVDISEEEQRKLILEEMKTRRDARLKKTNKKQKKTEESNSDEEE